MIYIRADANKFIGTGHMMRCLSIGKFLEKKGKNICFLVADESGASLVRDFNVSYKVLDSVWNQLEQEIPFITKILSEKQAEAILVDSYYVTENYLFCLQQFAKVIYIDDLNIFHYPCDVLINYAIYANDLEYDKSYTDIKLLLGCEYAPLRKEFSGILPKYIKEDVQDILVLTGGTDTYHFALNFVKSIEKRKPTNTLTARFHIICGRYHPDIEKLKELSTVHKELVVYEHVVQLDKLMTKVDIAVSAGGVSLYELCACGVPTVSYILADNQIKNVLKFDEIDLIENSGDVRLPEYDFDRLLDMVTNLSLNKEKRKYISKKMQKLVDGNGVSRIANLICNM